MKLYQTMANFILARQNCIKYNNTEYTDKHTETLNNLLENLPHGNGLDYTWHYDFTKSNENKIILTMSYHAMDENGYYDRIIDFTVSVKPSLINDIRLSINGNFGKYQDIKNYLYEILSDSLCQNIDLFKNS